MIFSTSSGGICKLTIEGLATSRIVDTPRAERYPSAHLPGQAGQVKLLSQIVRHLKDCSSMW